MCMDPRSKCAKCGILHLESCNVIVKEGDRALVCKDCTEDIDSGDDGARATKKRRKGEKVTLPEGDSTVEVDTSMSRNTVVHAEELFASRTNTYTGGSPLKTYNRPKLAIVDLTRQDFLFKDTPASKNVLKNAVEGLMEVLDEKGTIACAIPRPWYFKGNLLVGAFKEFPDKLFIDPTPVVISYQSVSGGAQHKSHELLHRNQQEHVLMVHRAPPAAGGTVNFTCNRRVVVSDVFGHSRGNIPHARHVIQLENLPAGAPNGGSRTFFPPTASQYFIARFTNAGDTVLGVGVESTTVAEDAISRGRRVEFYVTDESKRASLQAKISSTFHKAHSSGMFQSRRVGKEVVVGPNCLPAGLPPSTVPERVSGALKAALEKEPDEPDVLTASYTVAQTIAKTTHLTLQGDHHSPKLMTKKPRRASKARKEVSDIPVWGELIVYPSAQAAKDSLTQEEVDEEYVRLLRIATNA
ncbi:unnamed protein product [Ectocarpus sp. CCAP 1310/34]|nr:unnamed protein product [Ectocarpus sp. CCAP 1310/34]